MNRAAVIVVISLLIVGAVAVARTPAQQPAGPPELLAEVRLLREAIENLAGNGARVQIVFGRLQLQEQRTASAARRVEDLRGSLARVSREVIEMAGRLKDLEGIASDDRRSSEEHDNARMELNHLKRALESLEAERARLVAAEGEASAALGEDQGRWADLNRQLEELERTLAPRRQ